MSGETYELRSIAKKLPVPDHQLTNAEARKLKRLEKAFIDCAHKLGVLCAPQAALPGGSMSVTPEREAHLLHIIDVWKERAKTARAEGFRAGLEAAAKAVECWIDCCDPTEMATKENLAKAARDIRDLAGTKP